MDSFHRRISECQFLPLVCSLVKPFCCNASIECLDDIEAATAIFGYPRDLAYKLLDRKAKALVELGRPGEAVDAFDGALEAIEESNLKPDKKSDLSRGGP